MTLVDHRFKLIRPYQRDFVYSKKRFILGSGGVRAGKTLGNVGRILRLCLSKPKTFIPVVGESLPFLKRTIMRDWETYVPRELILDHKKIESRYILPHGSEVQFISGESPNSLKSLTCDHVCIEEMTNLKEESFQMLRTRISKGGKEASIFGATNAGPFTSYVYKMFVENPMANSEVIYSKSYDNPFLDDDYLEDLEDIKRTNPDYYRRMVEGQWGALEGLVFELPKDAAIIGRPKEIWDEEHQRWLFEKVIAGVDFGYNHPTAISVIGKLGNKWYLVDEVYRTEMGQDELESECHRLMDEFHITRFFADPSRKDIIEELRKKHIPMEKASNAVYDGIMYVKSVLGSGNFTVLRDQCPYHMREFDSYIWDKMKSDHPLKVNDHAMDAFRYAIYSYLKQSGFKFLKITADGAAPDVIAKRQAQKKEMGIREMTRRIRLRRRMKEALYKSE